MERKKRVLLTVIAVATLLVAVVGATFAYFTATNTNGTATEASEVETSKVSNVTLTMNPVSVTNEEKVYPGVMLGTGVELKSAWEKDADKPDGEWEITYKLKTTIDLSDFKTDELGQEWTDSEFTYTIYESDQSITTPVVSCARHEEDANKLYYDGCKVNDLLNNARKIAEDQPITLDNINGGQFDDETSGEKIDVTGTKYYYLVLNYKNNPNTSQNQDAGKNISIKFSGTSDAVLKKKTG